VRKAQTRVDLILELFYVFVHQSYAAHGEKKKTTDTPPKKDSPPDPVPVLSPVCTRKSGTTLERKHASDCSK
jgi:hypothetical protein